MVAALLETTLPDGSPMRLFGYILSVPPRLANYITWAVLGLGATSATWMMVARRSGNPLRLTPDEHGIDRPMTQEELIAEEVQRYDLLAQARPGDEEARTRYESIRLAYTHRLRVLQETRYHRESDEGIRQGDLSL